MASRTVTLPHDREIFIGGRWRSPREEKLVRVVSPATEKVVCELPDVSIADAELSVQFACAAFEQGNWPLLGVEERCGYVERWRAALHGRLDRIAELWTIEDGIPISLSRPMAEQVLVLIDDAIALAKQVPLTETRRTVAGEVEVRREPVGPALALLTFNGAILELGMSVVPGLLMGNPMIVKLPPENRLVGQLVADAAAEAGFPEGVLSVLAADAETSRFLVGHPDVDAVHFTGGTEIGADVAASCAQRIARVTLELGGKSAAIVADDADFDEIVPTLVNGAAANQGQMCIALGRTLVSRRRHDELVDKLVVGFRALRIGDRLDPATDFGPLVSARARDRAAGFIDRALAAGAKIATGGGRPSGQDRGHFLEPTLLVGVHNAMEVAQNEVFGPVFCVIPFDDIDDAVKIANDSAFGLYGTVFTKDEALANDLASRIRVGQFSFNGAFPCLVAPYGGMKQSGYGRVGAIEGLLELTNLKTIVRPAAG
jgi:acyl-CoA reductase-like NAD-dependent aldehyde dehydrogenase